MGDASAFLLSRDEIRARYRVRVLRSVRLDADGVIQPGEASRVVPWAAVRRALAAEVGEPQGVRAIVFDLVVASRDGGFDVLRFDAEPGDEATERARELALRLPAERLCAAIKSLAHEDVVGDWHPDLEAFEEAALASLVSLGI